MKYILLVKQFTKVWKDGIMNTGRITFRCEQKNFIARNKSCILIALSYNSGFTSTAFCNALSPVIERYIWERMGELIKICRKKNLISVGYMTIVIN
jgi:hypothetical protein